MDLGPHAIFIVLSYATAIVTLLLLIGWILIDHRALKRTLAGLEQQGVTRRSAARKPTP
jgi:heme exporter protein D